MIRFLKDRFLGSKQDRFPLGRLELERPLAYTTVMTTLDRLYKKGLLALLFPPPATTYGDRPVPPVACLSS